MHVLQLRGGFVETTHPVRAVAFVHGSAGPTQVWSGGAPNRSPWRSAGKPAQLWTALTQMEAAGHSENTGWTHRALSDEDLALGASSHSGQPIHTGRAVDLLDRFGCSAADLRCGAEPPAHAATRDQLIAEGQGFSALHNDCSGKHAFMLGACKARGWSLDYLDPAHPLQQHIHATVCAWTAEPVGQAVDGCGVPTFYLSVAAMARAWSRMAACMHSPDLDPLLARIGQAMADHPRLVSGDQRIDLALAQRATEPWVGKIGAGGVFNIALPKRRMAIALKVSTGNTEALAAAIPAVVDLVAPNALAPAKAWPWNDVRNVVGKVVGMRMLVGKPAPLSPTAGLATHG